ncbi:arsenate reductase family protein [Poseidonocella sedimentorum]|uniref:Arsenate reductase n=1 Tax=Poseidonocella sedimentorum TaxID=871652 RepID=A0A1I6EMW5_9RHOB|nr:ArsC/Spx/MgsR family protein [Poseidonocella sedimentorum]SFR19025.1 arsenate reductase [Poseidonocella sedimentorum]
MRIYGLKTCDTCRKAAKALDGAEVIDIRHMPMAPELRARAFETFGAALLNTRSTTWRGLSEAERARPPLELLEAHPALMKRPLIDDDTALHLGWGKDVQAALLG